VLFSVFLNRDIVQFELVAFFSFFFPFFVVSGENDSYAFFLSPGPVGLAGVVLAIVVFSMVNLSRLFHFFPLKECRFRPSGFWPP